MSFDPVQTVKRGEITVSRRKFLGAAIVGGSTIAMLGVLSMPEVSDAVATKLDRISLQQRLRSEFTSHRQAALTTAIQSVVVWAGNVTIGNLVDRLKVQHGGHAADGPLYAEEVRTRPLRTYIRDQIVVPVIEETFLRLLPSSFFTEERPQEVKLHWEVGLAANLLFGAIHNFSKPEPDKITIHLNSLPLEQLILGTYCWYAQRKGGFFHAVGAHLLYNHLCILYSAAFEADRDNHGREE